MKGKKRLLPPALLGALILFLATIVPAFSATGAVRFYDTSDTDEDQEWARQGGMVYLEVEDDDLDVDLAVTGERQTVPAGRGWFRVTNIPIVDRRGSRFLTEEDVDVVVRNADGSPGRTLAVDRVSEDGRVDLVDRTFSGDVLVSYKGAVANDTGDTVAVRSRQEPNGISVTLEETNSGSGVFRLAIRTTSGDSDANSISPLLEVAKSDTITLRYNEDDPDRTVTETLNVETTPPVFSNIMPAHGSAGRADPEVEFDVTDARSGVADEDSVWVIFAADDDDDGIIERAHEYRVNGAPRGHIDPIDRGFRVRMGLPRSFEVGSDATIYWWALAQDAAGNLGILDRPKSADDTFHPCFPPHFPRGDVDGTDVTAAIHVGGCMPRAAMIDNTGPTIKRVITGRWWDPSKDGDDKTEYDPTKARNTSILVAFSEDLDSSTVQNSDFRVDGAVPMKAEVFSGRLDYVFLTVSPLAADAQPEVEVLGSILDLAGNHLGAGTPDDDGDEVDPDPTPSKDGFELLVAVLEESESIGAYSDELGDLLADLFIEYLIVPITEETPGEVETRLLASDSALSDNSLDYLIAVTNDARRIEALPDTLADLLSDLFIEYLIVPVTDETEDEAKDRLSAQ